MHVAVLAPGMNEMKACAPFVLLLVALGCANSRPADLANAGVGPAGSGGSGPHSSGGISGGSTGSGPCDERPACGFLNQACCTNHCGDVNPCNGGLLCCSNERCSEQCPEPEPTGGTGGIASDEDAGYEVTDCAVAATDVSLPGVTVRLEGDRCIFESGEGGTFRYAIEVEEPIAFTQEPSAGCYECARSLVSTSIGEDLVYYDESDTSCCTPFDGGPQTLPATPIIGTIAWPGVQWHGLDWGPALGPPFPPGEYFVRVSILLTGTGIVIAELPIVVNASEATPAGASCRRDDEYVYPNGHVVPAPPGCVSCLCDNGNVTACTEVACALP